MAHSLAFLILALPRAARTSPTAVAHLLVTAGARNADMPWRSVQFTLLPRRKVDVNLSAAMVRRPQRAVGGHRESWGGYDGDYKRGGNSVHRLSCRWALASSWGHRTALAIQETSLCSLVQTETGAVKCETPLRDSQSRSQG